MAATDYIYIVKERERGREGRRTYIKRITIIYYDLWLYIISNTYKREKERQRERERERESQQIWLNPPVKSESLNSKK